MSDRIPSRNIKAKFLVIMLLLTAFYFFSFSSWAQSTPSHNLLSPIQLTNQTHLLASAANPSVLPTDTTPFQVNRSRYALGSRFKFRLFQKLPASLWFTIIDEETGRWETNVYQTATNGRQDFVFRSLPNITLGYALGAKTNIYCNYFVIKDIYAAPSHGSLDFPTTMSLSGGVRRDFPVSRKTVFQFDMQVRELWETAGLRQSDLLPAINLTRILTPKALFFGSVLLQMRSAYPFEGPTRELDPFYNIGLAISRNNWNFVASQTYVTNFRDPPFHNSVPPQGNVSMICDFEAAHPISSRLPGVMWFIRAEPIWNWRSHWVAGQSGYDFRLYSGLRFTFSKPAYNTDMDELRENLKRQAQNMLQQHTLPGTTD